MLLDQLLRLSADGAPDSVALVEPTRTTVTYGQLNRLVSRFANLYLSSGLEHGERVVIALDNSVEMVAAYFGAMRAGGVAVPLPGGPRSDRLLKAVEDCAPRLCVADAAAALQLTTHRAMSQAQKIFVLSGASPTGRQVGTPLNEALQGTSDATPPARCNDLDLAAIIYTSGSTGEPRGVMLSHRNFVANARSIVQYLELTSRDRVMCVLPFYYVYGLSLLHTHMMVGGSVVLDNRFAFPNVVLAAMQEARVTGFAGVPSTFALLLHRSNLLDTPLPDLRYVTQAGGRMPPARILEWLDRGPKAPFYVMYGATEAAARLTFLPPDQLRVKLGSIGRPIPDVEILIVDNDGRQLGPREVGELVARGANVSRGYWNRPQESHDRFGPLGYRTGDLGFADEDGFLFLVGRRNDMIKVGAHRVGAKEIEDVLHESADVHEAAVVAVPHDILGEVPIAFVVLRTPQRAATGTLQAFCASRLPSYKVPEKILVLDDLPKLSGTGKVDKTALKALAPTFAGPVPQAVVTPLPAVER
jgi:long-chain acyl-CoA synthetase